MEVQCFIHKPIHKLLISELQLWMDAVSCLTGHLVMQLVLLEQISVSPHVSHHQIQRMYCWDLLRIPQWSKAVFASAFLLPLPAFEDSTRTVPERYNATLILKFQISTASKFPRWWRLCHRRNPVKVVQKSTALQSCTFPNVCLP